MNKAYLRINWENYPSDETPINERNLNKMDSAIDIIDGRVISLNETKLNLTVANEMVKNILFSEETGIFTVEYLNGSIYKIDTKLEKLAVNFRYDNAMQRLVIVLADGTEQEVDLSSLISQYEFFNTDTVSFSVQSDGKVSAMIPDGSITEKKLQPNYLADIKIEVFKAKEISQSVERSETNAKIYMNSAAQYRDQTKEYVDNQQCVLDEINKKLGMTIFSVDDKGNLIYDDAVGGYSFSVDDNGNLNYFVAV